MSVKVVLELKVGAAMACADKRMKDPDVIKQALDEAFMAGFNGDHDEIIEEMDNLFSNKYPGKNTD